MKNLPCLDLREGICKDVIFLRPWASCRKLWSFSFSFSPELDIVRLLESVEELSASISSSDTTSLTSTSPLNESAFISGMVVGSRKDRMIRNLSTAIFESSSESLNVEYSSSTFSR